MRWFRPLCLLSVLLLVLVNFVAAEEKGRVEGVVRDATEAAISGATVVLRNAQTTPVAAVVSDTQGRFRMQVPAGRYVLEVAATGFASHEQVLSVREEGTTKADIRLGIESARAELTVTAVAGRVEDRLDVAPAVNIVSAANLQQRAKSVLAQAAQEEPGLELQRTSPTVSGVFVRGLTGSKVNVFVDGVRYTTGAMRGGINTFLNLIEPSSIETLEVLRGPSSAQYGSDAIGGSLQFLTSTPHAGDGKVHGSWSTGGNSSDWSWGSNLGLNYSTKQWALLSNIAGRRASTLRTGGGVDSHSALARFLDIPSTTLYDRDPDTAFTQYGGMFKMVFTPVEGTNLTASYLRGQQDGGRRFDQLVGGDGNLVADLRNLMNDFLYLRVNQARAGWLDYVTLTYSYNVQREERVNQGGQGNPVAAVTHEPERLRAHGVQFSTGKELGQRVAALMGADYFHERIAAASFQENTPGGTTSMRRGRVPDNAQYEHGGAYLQGHVVAWPQKLRFTGSVRYSAASYRARAADSPVVSGQPLWPDDSLRVSDWTGRAGVVFTPAAGLSLVANFSRGFRAPNITDLGTIGLTGSGFEASAPELAGRGAMVGNSAGANAASTGLAVRQLRPETNWLYEGGLRYRHARFETELTLFVNDFFDTIEKFALILPPGAVGQSIGGQSVTSQNANGTVFVAASANPVLIRANFGDARIRGLEHDMEARFARGLTLHTTFTWLRAEDPRTGLAPNIEGGTPPADFWLKVRYAPASRWWVEPYMHAGGRQDRLSSLDLADRRTGAERNRSSIQNFFRRGARVRGLVNNGADGIASNADDILIPTGEKLAQVQDRVLGAGVDSNSLFSAVPGYAMFGVRGGVHIRERHEVFVDFENIGDRNYRGISWGVDAPGRSLAVRYQVKF